MCYVEFLSDSDTSISVALFFLLLLSQIHPETEKDNIENRMTLWGRRESERKKVG